MSRSEMKHQAILKSAKKVFLKEGFKASSMDEIAKQASVSKKTVYHHFPSKKKLLQAMIEQHWQTLLSMKTTIFDLKKSPSLNLERFAKAFLTFLYQPDTIDLFRLLIGEGHQLADLLEPILINSTGPYTRELIDYLNAMKKTNILQIKQPKRAAHYFIGLLKEGHFWPMMLGFTHDKRAPDEAAVIKEAVAIFLDHYAVTRTQAELS